MRIENQNINGRKIAVLIADEGKELARKHDSTRMGGQIYLGVDYSTGVPRDDNPEYYEEIDAEPGEPTEAEKDEALKILGVEL